MQYLLYLCQLVAIFSISALALRVLIGQVGLLSLAQGAFMAIGAYTAAQLSLIWDANIIVALVAAAASSFTTAFLLSFPLLRLRGDNFVLATLAIQAIILNLSKNLTAVTNGNQGLVGIPSASEFRPQVALLTIIASLMTATIVLLVWLSRTRVSTLLASVRDNEGLAQSLGLNTTLALRITFAAVAGVAGIAGGLYAYLVQFIDPNTFALTESVLLLTIVIIGGVNRTAGPIVGALILIGLPEALRFLPLPEQTAANARQMILGAILVVFVFVRPSDLKSQEI